MAPNIPKTIGFPMQNHETMTARPPQVRSDDHNAGIQPLMPNLLVVQASESSNGSWWITRNFPRWTYKLNQTAEKNMKKLAIKKKKMRNKPSRGDFCSACTSPAESLKLRWQLRDCFQIRHPSQRLQSELLREAEASAIDFQSPGCQYPSKGSWKCSLGNAIITITLPWKPVSFAQVYTGLA